MSRRPYGKMGVHYHCMNKEEEEKEEEEEE